MRIGELARQAGVNIQTLRFYERERLLRSPLRSESGYRIYEQRDLERVYFIRRCQGLGFTLREIRELSRLHEVLAFPQKSTKRSAVEGIVHMANQRLTMIDQKIRDLKKMRSELASLAVTLSRQSPAVCPAGK
jgi:MerR family transcriptional regulator, copper efflux regulator